MRADIVLPKTDEPPAQYLGQVLGDLPVLPVVGWTGGRFVSLVGDYAHLAAAMFLIYPDYRRAHEEAAGIYEVD